MKNLLAGIIRVRFAADNTIVGLPQVALVPTLRVGASLTWEREAAAILRFSRKGFSLDSRAAALQPKKGTRQP